MAEAMKAQFGLPQEWDHFAESHGLFLERFSNLQMALETAFNRQEPLSELVDKIVFFIGRPCAEDFMEILLLCGNGYGIGAMKILRGTCTNKLSLHATSMPNRQRRMRSAIFIG